MTNDELPTGQWISTQDALPLPAEITFKVFDGRLRRGVFDGARWYVTDNPSSFSFATLQVTHWLRLPPRPEERG